MKVFLIALLCFLAIATALQGAYPEKPIRVIVPTAAGGGHDTVARVFQRTIEEGKLLSEKLVVVNIPGAGGAVGTRKIKDSTNDGYTIGVWNPNALISAKLMGITNYDHTDYEIIAMTGYTDLGMGVKEDSPIKDLSDLIERAKLEPGSMKLATEIGTAAHIIPEILADKGGFEFRVVPSGGGSKRLASLLGGHTDISLFSSLALINFQASGIRPLLLFSEERTPLLTDTPTALESGIALAINESRIWLAPKGTDNAKLEVIRAALRAAIETPDAKKRLEGLGITPIYGNEDSVLSDIDRMRDLTEPIIPKIRRR